MADVTFTSWGSANSIGASCHVLTFGGYRVGIDYGAGVREGEEEPQYDAPLDAVFITHGHRDHVGMLPRALARWPKALCWATFETRELASWIWADALKIDRQKERPDSFSLRDSAIAYQRIKIMTPGYPLQLTKDLSVTPFDAGHILGAIGLVFTYRGERYVATGDISLLDHQFILGATVPVFPRTRLLIRESTYAGQGASASREDTGAVFVKAIVDVLEGGGRVVIPTLAIDRMPEIYMLLHAAGIDNRWPLWVIGGDTPVEIYRNYAPKAGILRTMRRFGSVEHEWLARASGSPMVVLASSGMLAENTPSYTWATEVLSASDCAIFMVNWQDPCTPGGAILAGAHDEEIQLPTGRFPRRCRIERFDFSTHAKDDEMESIEKRLQPEQIIHVHGDDTRIDAFLASAPDRARRQKALVGEVVVV